MRRKSTHATASHHCVTSPASAHKVKAFMQIIPASCLSSRAISMLSTIPSGISTSSTGLRGTIRGRQCTLSVFSKILAQRGRMFIDTQRLPGPTYLKMCPQRPQSTATTCFLQFLRGPFSQATKSNNVTSRSQDGLSVPLCCSTTAVGIVLSKVVEKPIVLECLASKWALSLRHSLL